MDMATLSMGRQPADIGSLHPDDLPEKRRTKLSPSNQSFQITLMKRAVDAAGRELDDPGTVEQIWFEDEQLVVIDLSNDE
jgi:hypothetical protein